MRRRWNQNKACCLVNSILCSLFSMSGLWLGTNNMTFQKIPDEVTKFQLTFLPPSQPNGNIRVYQALVYREDDPTAVQIHNLSIIQKTDTSIIAMLEGGWGSCISSQAAQIYEVLSLRRWTGTWTWVQILVSVSIWKVSANGWLSTLSIDFFFLLFFNKILFLKIYLLHISTL